MTFKEFDHRATDCPHAEKKRKDLNEIFEEV